MNGISLPNLASQINDFHLEAESHAKKALMFAIQAGEHLNNAKSKVQHGQWMAWLKENINFSKRKAQTYMRLANHREEIEKNAESALLGIDGALKLVADSNSPVIDNSKSKLYQLIEYALTRLEISTKQFHDSLDKDEPTLTILNRLLRNDLLLENIIEVAQEQFDSIDESTNKILNIAIETAKESQRWRSENCNYALDLELWYLYRLFSQNPSYDKYLYIPDYSHFKSLKNDIYYRGVLVAIEYDESGNLLDGHLRLKACKELGINNYPIITRIGLTEEDKYIHVKNLNMHRSMYHDIGLPN